MNATSWTTYAACLVLVGVFPLVAGCASVETERHAAIQQQIESARTRADHNALATHYEQEAAAAKEKAQAHERMAKVYWAPGAAPGKGYPSLGMYRHCENLVKRYQDIAEQNLALAKLHRDLAAQAKE